MTVTGRRKDSRLRVEIPAQLITLHGSPRGFLCDLSLSGARLRTQDQLRIGEEAVLNWLQFETFGTVVWIAGTYAGLQFDELLTTAVLMKTRETFDAGLAPSEKETVYRAAHNWYLGQR